MVVTQPEPQQGKTTSTSRRAAQPLLASRAARSTVAAAAGFGGLGFGWFVVSWTILDSPLIDAVGEATGGVMVILLMVAIFGSLLRSR